MDMEAEHIKPCKLPAMTSMAAVVVVLAGVYQASSLIVPFLLAVFFAVLSDPPIEWMQRRGLPRSIGIPLVLVVLIVLVTGIGGAIGSSLNGFGQDLPAYEESLRERVGKVLVWARAHQIHLPEQTLSDHLDGSQVLGLAHGILSGLSAALSNAFLIFVTVLFILFEVDSFPCKLQAILRRPDESMRRFTLVLARIRRYIAIKSITSLLTGVAVAIWMMLFDVHYALLWGVLAFILNFIPNIGSILAAVPAILFAFVQSGIGVATWTAVGFLVINNIVGNILEPKYLGRGLGLSTLVVFVSLVFWGWLLGPVGMFLSVPLTMTVKIVLESASDTRWMAVLLGTEADARNYAARNAAPREAVENGSARESDSA